MSIFQDVVYSIDPLLSSTLKTYLTNLLESNGATQANEINLYISKENTHNQSNVHSVTPLWVEVAVNNGFVHNPKYYSPSHPNSFLSGVVLTLLDIPPPEIQLIAKQIKKYCGQIRNDLTEDITHLICIDPRGAQYTHCIEHRIPVVLPQWLDDCQRFQERLDPRPYQFPTPIIQTPAPLYPYPSLEHLSNNPSGALSRHTLYFGKDIQIKDDFKLQLINAIKRAGGNISTEYNTLVTLVILKYRSEEAMCAFRDHKEMASLWWLTNTLARGHYLSPMRSLLDYPVPLGGILGMERVSITITGYKGPDREFLRRLVIHAGAVLNPLMDASATHLICGDKRSAKYEDAKRRGLQIVNHLWLEECFTMWRILKMDRRHLHLTSVSVGKTHLFQDKVELWWEPETRPEHQPAPHAYQVIGLDENGSVEVLKPRQAAVRAIRVLNSIVMPDVNAFEKEKWSPRKKSRV